MRKDHILTPEEKLSKQQRLEENRRIRTTQISNNDTNNEIVPESSQLNTSSEPVNEKKIYFSVCQKQKIL
jgi:hypothetical protein